MIAYRLGEGWRFVRDTLALIGFGVLALRALSAFDIDLIEAWQAFQAGYHAQADAVRDHPRSALFDYDLLDI